MHVFNAFIVYLSVYNGPGPVLGPENTPIRQTDKDTLFIDL